MKHKYLADRKWFILIIGVLVLVMSVVVYLFVISRQGTTTQVAPPEPSQQSSESDFSFAGADGWRKGPSNRTSLALFHDNACFVSVELIDGVVDVPKELEDMRAADASLGLERTSGSTEFIVLRADDAYVNYQLRTYSVSGVVGGQKVKGGQALGYVQLANRYVEVKGNCDTANDLTVLPNALKAISYKAER